MDHADAAEMEEPERPTISLATLLCLLVPFSFQALFQRAVGPRAMGTTVALFVAFTVCFVGWVTVLRLVSRRAGAPREGWRPIVAAMSYTQLARLRHRDLAPSWE